MQKNNIISAFFEKTKEKSPVTSGFEVVKINKTSGHYFDLKVIDTLTGVTLFLVNPKGDNDVIISDIGMTAKSFDPEFVSIMVNNGSVKRESIAERFIYAATKGVIGNLVNVGKNGTLSITVEPTINAIVGGCLFLIGKIEELQDINKSFVEL
jgi:hypothetical protein